MGLAESSSHSASVVVMEHLAAEHPVEALLGERQRRHLFQHALEVKVLILDPPITRAKPLHLGHRDVERDRA